MTPRPVLRPLTLQDEASLRAFRCTRFHEPWTDVVEEMVRERLVGALPTVTAVGAWLDEELCGVAAWRFAGSVCTCVVVAVRTGRRGHRIGRLLKEHVVTAAEASGAAAVVSNVHWDNGSMLALNACLGASVERIPGDPEYCRCVIPVRGGRGT